MEKTQNSEHPPPINKNEGVVNFIQYWTKHLQPNNANLVSIYKRAAFFQFREITM